MLKKRHWFYLPAYLFLVGMLASMDIPSDLPWWRIVLGVMCFTACLEFVQKAESVTTKKVEIFVTGNDCASDVLKKIAFHLEQSFAEGKDG